MLSLKLRHMFAIMLIKLIYEWVMLNYAHVIFISFPLFLSDTNSTTLRQFVEKCDAKWAFLDGRVVIDTGIVDIAKLFWFKTAFCQHFRTDGVKRRQFDHYVQFCCVQSLTSQCTWSLNCRLVNGMWRMCGPILHGHTDGQRDMSQFHADEVDRRFLNIILLLLITIITLSGFS